MSASHLIASRAAQARRCRRPDYEWAEQATSSALDRSNVDLLSDGKRIVDLDTKIPHCTLNLGVAKQQLNRTQIAGAPVN